MWIDPNDKAGVALAKQQEDLTVAALIKLPLAHNDPAFMTSVYEQARAWLFGQTAPDQCAVGAKTVAAAAPTGDQSAVQNANASIIYQAAQAAHAGDRGAQIGIAVGLAESGLLNVANDGTSTDMGTFDTGGHRQLNAAERAIARKSLTYPHDSVGHNLDSIGLFQQRPSAGWGAPADLINPARSAGIFFSRLTKVPGWETSSTPWTAGQTVQGSPSSDGAIYQAQYTKAGVILAAVKAAGVTAGAQNAALPVGPSSSPAAPAAPAAGVSTAMPYPLPATHGFTGYEAAINTMGSVDAGRSGQVTFSSFASLGQPYRDFYITMRWNYAAWNYDGTSTDIDQAQNQWFAAKPRLVLVSNPRTGKSIISDVMESGPAPWVGTAKSSGNGTDPSGIWKNPTRGTPDGYKGIVSGFPPAAISALGAVAGYPGQTGDDLIYQWAPDQNAIPGPTTLVAMQAGPGATSASLGLTGCAPCPSDLSGISVGGNLPNLTAEQITNAQAIAKVAISRNLGQPGVLLGIVTSLTEATLINVHHGDAAGPSSIGLFQQMPSWGPLSVRTDPAGAAGLFFDRVVTIPNWQTIDPWVVAQTVQSSEFVAGYTGEGSDGTVGYNYHHELAQAQAIVAALLGSTGTGAAPGAVNAALTVPIPATATPAAPTSPTTTAAPASALPAAASAGAGQCSPPCPQAAVSTSTAASSAAASAGSTAPSGSPAAAASVGGCGTGSIAMNGPNITIPDNPDVAPELRGQIIHTPNAQVETGIAWGLAQIGIPYVYGGGGLGSANAPPNVPAGRSGPDNGCARASCLNLVGYDCSGLSYSVYDHMAPFIDLTVGYSGAMHDGGVHIPLAQAAPGDLVTYGGAATHHVAVSLGYINGKLIVLEAPDTGLNVRVKASSSGDINPTVSRYWTATK